MSRPTREIQVRREPAPEDGDGRPALLLVEDDLDLRSTLQRRFGVAFDITAVADGANAASLLTKRVYDCILSDIGLPGMTGVDLLRLVRTYDLDVPVVLMTAQPTVETAVAALELGAFTYLQKPFDLAEVEGTLLRATKLAKLARVKREAIAAGLGGSPIAGDRAGLEAVLRRALETLHVVFQPIVDRGSGQTTGYEALMRTREPSLPDPHAVLEAARRLDRLQEIGRRVREVAAATFRPPDGDALLFVNLHPADLLDSQLYAANAPLTALAHRVVLEITERTAIDDIVDTQHRVNELRFRGFRLAIDDLGAGYAGLTSFATLEPEFVKLDMSLVRDIETSQVKAQVVDSVTRMCRDVGVKVVAEGIETRAELARVIELGCHYLQGYLLGRPSPTPVPSISRW